MSSNWTRPFQLTYPLNARQVEEIDSMFQKLFSKFPLNVNRGGTGRDFADLAIGDLIYGNVESDGVTPQLSLLTSVTAGSYLRSGGLLTAPLWSTLKLPNTAAVGDILIASTLNTVTGLAIGAAGTIIRSNGTIPANSSFTIPNTFATGDVLYASATNVVSGLGGGATGKIIRFSGTVPTWSTMTYPNQAAAGGIFIATFTDTMGLLAIDTAGKMLRSTGTAPGYTTFTMPLTFAQGDLLHASATNIITALTKDTNATRYLSNTGASNNPAWAQIALATGVSGDLPFANLAQGAALSVLGVTGNSIADVASIVAANDHEVLRRSGTAVAFGAINLAQSAAVTGDLPFANLVQASAASRLIGRGSASGAGDFQEITLGTGLTMTNQVLSSVSGAAGSDTQVQFNDGGTNLGGDAGLVYNKTTDALTMGSGVLTLGQLAFPATQNPSANANTLDDYEEGDWTPTLQFGGAAVGITYVAGFQVGSYVKTGRQVLCCGVFLLSSKGSSTGNALVTGLPFVIGTPVKLAASSKMSYSSFTAGVQEVGLQTIPNTSTLTTVKSLAGANTTMTDADYTANTFLIMYLCYFTD